jgi:hypothetical protein
MSDIYRHRSRRNFSAGTPQIMAQLTARVTLDEVQISRVKVM